MKDKRVRCHLWKWEISDQANERRMKGGLTGRKFRDSKVHNVFCFRECDLARGRPWIMGDRRVEFLYIYARVLHAMLLQMGGERRTPLDTESTVNIGCGILKQNEPRFATVFGASVCADTTMCLLTVSGAGRRIAKGCLARGNGASKRFNPSATHR